MRRMGPADLEVSERDRHAAGHGAVERHAVLHPADYGRHLHAALAPEQQLHSCGGAAVSVGGIAFTATPTTVTPAGTVTARLVNGPGNTGDWVGLFAGDGSRLTWKYLNGSQSSPAVGLTSADVPFAVPMTAGTYTLRLYANFSQTLLATSAPITVATPAATTVTVAPTTIAPDGTVQATMVNGLGNPADWVGLFATGASMYLDWKYLNGTPNVPAIGMTGGTVSFTMPTTPGTYVLRFYANNTYTLLAESATITVRCPSCEHDDRWTWVEPSRPRSSMRPVTRWTGWRCTARTIIAARLEIPERHANDSGRRHYRCSSLHDAGRHRGRT